MTSPLRHYVLANPRLFESTLPANALTGCGLTRTQLGDGLATYTAAGTTCPACRAFLIDYRLNYGRATT